ncbi:MAG: arginine--tRNA ligase [Candidatus Hadarchaeales archaeon]
MTVNPWEEFKQDAISVLEKALKEKGWKVDISVEKTIEIPPSPELGDLSSTIVFELSKTMHKAPTWISSEISKLLKPTGLIEKISITNNYINFFVSIPKLAELTVTSIEKLDKAYGTTKSSEGKVIIEHTSINPTKPLHIGHGRNAILGDTIARIMRAQGREVEVHNYIDDMGRQMAETILAYQKIGEKPKTKFDHMLGLIYAEMHAKLESSEELEKEVAAILSQLEKGEEKTVKLARGLAEKCLKENLVTTDRLGISYDVLIWESDLVGSGVVAEALEKLKKAKKLVAGKGEKEGTLVLRLSDLGMEDKILVRSDGTTVYTARDIAYQLWKFGKSRSSPKFKLWRPKLYTTSPSGRAIKKFGGAEMVINVVGREQKYPQQVVFAALKLLGLDEEYRNSHHLAYEHVWLPSGKFSGRKGTWVGYSVDEVIEEAVARAYEIVKEHAPEAGEKFWREAAEFVGIGAIRFSLLATSPEKKIVFRWEEALNFERNSGPAIQYSHARACSILRKAGKRWKPHSFSVFQKPQEHRLIKLLSRYPEVLAEAGRRLQPHLLANYAAELAFSFNTFYEECPVMRAEGEELRSARLRLVNCVRIVLRNALELMGIKAPEKM